MTEATIFGYPSTGSAAETRSLQRIADREEEDALFEAYSDSPGVMNLNLLSRRQLAGLLTAATLIVGLSAAALDGPRVARGIETRAHDFLAHYRDNASAANRTDSVADRSP